ncbi:unnamed protein product, partial [Darwinula stevensoni]
MPDSCRSLGGLCNGRLENPLSSSRPVWPGARRDGPAALPAPRSGGREPASGRGKRPRGESEDSPTALPSPAREDPSLPFLSLLPGCLTIGAQVVGQPVSADSRLSVRFQPLSPREMTSTSRGPARGVIPRGPPIFAGPISKKKKRGRRDQEDLQEQSSQEDPPIFAGLLLSPA